ncbi:MAG: SDR family oxidoreductase [Myxococcales bacterium]|nr:SDR family oxidoreductase [Myxococcales bacterium]MCB9565645.1 SDR family oxidoreductase [Myxococcales bacterium]MCB9703199.1 SDR family oxidoreductase [Myxococcales bacterium]
MLTIDLRGRLALVTGATGELGRVIAVTLAECGADLAVHYHRDRAGADALVEAIRGRGRRAAAFAADVGDADAVKAMQAAIADELGAPSIVVINAVQQIHPWSRILDEAIADYESQLRTSVIQSVALAQAFVPGMIAAGWGRVIGINSECAIEAAPYQSAYVAGKRGMDGILRVLAREVGADGITVNQVAPGWTITERERAEGRVRAPEYEARVPMRRRGEDHEVARVVAFLASELASFVSGAFIPVSGGTVMPAI